MTEKHHSGDDAAFAWKMVGKVLIESGNSFRWRHVGWVPFLALVVAIAGILWPHDTPPGMFSGLAQVMVVSAALVVWCPLFFSIACFQWRKYRKDENRSTVLAFVSMCLHGAMAVCALVPVLRYLVAILR